MIFETQLPEDTPTWKTSVEKAPNEREIKALRTKLAASEQLAADRLAELKYSWQVQETNKELRRLLEQAQVEVARLIGDKVVLGDKINELATLVLESSENAKVLEAENGRLRKALGNTRSYLSHKYDCDDGKMLYAAKCTCQFDALRDQVIAAPSQAEKGK